MLWRDFEPVAVLDWEMATVGPREVDVAWMIFLHSLLPGPRGRDSRCRDCPTSWIAARSSATYEEMTGHRVHALEWFEVLRGASLRVVSIRTSTRGIAYGSMEKPDDPDDLVMFRTLLEQMLAGTYWDT